MQSCIKTGMKLYKELRLQGNHCLYTFIESEVRNDKVHKVEKVTKINSKIISKPCAYLQTMAKTFIKICIKLYEELRSQGTHCHNIFIESEVRK